MEVSKTNNQNKVTNLLLIIYLLVIFWAIVLKMQLNIFSFSGVRSLNLIPYSQSMIVNNKIDMSEIIYNIIAFIPFGIYISILKPNLSFVKKLGIIFSTSLLFETLQFVFAIGASDITDLINNTMGGFIGLAIYFILSKIFRSQFILNKVLNIVSVIGTIFILSIISILFLLN